MKFLLSIPALLLAFSALGATNFPVQFSTPDYRLLSTNFFRSNFVAGSTNMGITYDERGRPTFWVTNYDAGGAAIADLQGATNGLTSAIADVMAFAQDRSDHLDVLDGIFTTQIAALQAATNALNNRLTSNGWIRLQIQSCILPTNNAPGLDTGTNYIWRLLFDDTTDESAYWQFVLPDDYATNATIVCTYSMLVSVASKTNVFQFATQVLRPLVSNNINVSSFADSGGATNIIPTSSGWATNFTGNLSLSAVAGDLIRLKVNRDADNTMDSATGDAVLHAIAIRYTRQ
jgi:hypothetical protein